MASVNAIPQQQRVVPLETDSSILANQARVNTLSSPEGPEIYRVYAYRWVVLFSYFFIMLASGATYSVFIPFSVYMQEIYGVSHVAIVLTLFTFHGIYPFSTFFMANYVIVSKGTKFALICAIIGMMACLWIRALINVWVYFINIASVVGALIDPLQCNVAAKLAANWFPMSQQVTANTIGSLASILGGIIGGFYTITYFDTEVKDVDEARSMILHGLIYIATTYTIIYSICILLYRDKPESPPCQAASAAEAANSKPITEQLLILVKNVNFILIMLIDLSHCIVLGCLASNISPLLTANGITDTMQIVMVSGAYLIVGLIGCAINSLIMQRFKRFKLILSVCSTLGVVFHFFLYVLVRQESIVPIVIFGGLVGLFEMPARGLIVAFECEVAYPVSEAIIYGFTLVVYCFFTLFAAIGTAVFFEDPERDSVFIYGIVTSCIMFIGTTLIIFIKEDLRRSKVEEDEDEKKKTQK